MNPVADLAAVLDSAGDLIAGIARWDKPTPCPEWTVRELVNHLVLGHRLFTDVLRGAPGGSLDPKSEDVLGADPAAAYRRAAAKLLAEFGKPGVLAGQYTVPAGSVPGAAAARLLGTEHLVHGWDLAVATGQKPAFDDTVVARHIEFSQAKIADLPPGRRPFAPPVPVAGDASPLDRLAALLGRSPN
ncbi:TIGR03086 family metal-binding protein [Amycolatopsis benzoatilytica]|uniref:TIGR03086 family metal-binding protein n=1 Tax=Amycolatopsis benzoatilytica TaxID=346045 RepID=UPI000376F412|nr:TIGR03086 family metal-binding protein [Amycolatopsis benzoatilytica]